MATKYSSLIFLMILISFPIAELFAKEIYVWKDENGITVYSDIKRPGAKKLSLSDDNLIIMKKVNTSVFDQPKKQQEKTPYSVEISSPSHEETIRDNSGKVNVFALIKPSFNPSYRVQLLLDGKVVKPAQQSPVFSLNEVDRGEYSLQVQLVNNKGDTIASSKQITIFMHRVSVIGRN